MLQRIFFSIREGLRYRLKLKAIPYVQSIKTVDWQALYASGVRVVVLDFDGVLAADKQEELVEGVASILHEIIRIFGEHVYIFSNQPRKTRQCYFEQYFPQIQFLIAKKKPYPDGLLSIIAREKVDAQIVVLIDDRVLTGGLASVLAGTRCLIVEKPYVCLHDHFFRELMFMSIRFVERLMFR